MKKTVMALAATIMSVSNPGFASSYEVTNTWISFLNGGGLNVENNKKRHYKGSAGGIASNNVYAPGETDPVGTITACIFPNPSALDVAPSASCNVSCETYDKSKFSTVGYLLMHQTTDPKGTYGPGAKIEQYMRVGPGYPSNSVTCTE